MSLIYAEAAPRYRANGWSGVLPLPPRKKKFPPKGYTGTDGVDPSDLQVEAWINGKPNGNIGIRVPPGVVGYDADLYKVAGQKTHAALVDKCGELPATWVSTSRTDGSGIRFYRIPLGVKLRGAFGGVEIIQFHHRYAVVAPSIHPDTDRPYRLISPDGEIVETLPHPSELPELPQKWLDELRLAEPTAAGDRPPRVHTTGDWSNHVKDAHADALAGLVKGSRHDTALAAALQLVRYEDLDYPGAADALESLGRVFRVDIADRASPAEADKEWGDILESARARVASTPPAAARWEDTREARQRTEAERPASRDGSAAPPLSDSDAPPGDESAPARKGKPSQATLLVDLAEAAAFFHTPDGDPFADVAVAGHRETWPLRTKGFRRWLAQTYYDSYGSAAGSQAVQDALGVLEGRALFAGDERAVHVRVASLGGVLYLDLGDPAWRAVEVTVMGWKVIDDVPVRFRRPRGALPLPAPEPGGALDALVPFVNVAKGDWPLVVAWLVAALRAVGPYPVLNLLGEQGSAKSTTARVLRALVDPNRSPARAEPREARDLAVAAANSWVVSFDNVSRLPVWLSDSVCRLSTGGGFGTRELYSDADEVIFDAQRPVIMNGIAELATRPDLLDRSLLLYLPRIAGKQRRAEADLWADFDGACPRLLGAALDAVVGALRNLPTTALAEPPRMADFALWATAAEPALGLEPGAFLAAYCGNREAADSLALEASPIAQPVLDLLPVGTWRGTATQLLHALVLKADEDAQRQPGWPRGASALSNELRRLAPVLRAAGLAVMFERQAKTGRRLIVLERSGKTPSPPSPASPTPSDQHKQGDDGVTTIPGGDDDAVTPPLDGVTPENHPDLRKQSEGDEGDEGDGDSRSRSNSVSDDEGEIL